jgi:hypothetical protein
MPASIYVAMRRARFFALMLAAVVGFSAFLPAGSAAAYFKLFPREYDPDRSATRVAQRPYRVGVQVGHYKNNELPDELSRLSGHTGTAGGGRTEVDLNLDVSNRVARLLRAQGVVVDILPATVPTGYTADAFIAIHADGSSSTRSRGFKISTRWRSEIALQDAMLVEMLTEAYRAATGLPEDSTITRNMRGYYAYSPWRPNYRVSNFTPGAIVEMGFMTNAADRAVLFNSTDKVAAGIANGVMRFLRAAYGGSGGPSGTRPYGYGIIDDDIVPNPTPTPATRSGSSQNSRARVMSGDWRILLFNRTAISAYSRPGGGAVVATLSKGQFYRSTLRNGDYYRILLPDGREGWVHRNWVIVQM